MQYTKLIALIFFIAIAHSIPTGPGINWAVLVAGSSSWYNYRHQADVLHAYQMLIQQGFDSSKIIVFAYDDIAQNIKNPFPGKIFNKPTYGDEGIDVYEGVNIDYSGK